MNRTKVESSSMKSVGYEAGTLEIEFAKGVVYQYPGVPEKVYKELRDAASPGSFFHQNIKQQYPGTRLEAVALAEAALAEWV